MRTRALCDECELLVFPLGYRALALMARPALKPDAAVRSPSCRPRAGQVLGQRRQELPEALARVLRVERVGCQYRLAIIA